MGHFHMEQVDERGVVGTLVTFLFWSLGMITVNEAVQWVALIVGATTIVLNIQKFIMNRKKKNNE